MKNHHFSIRTTLFVVIATLNLLIAVLVGLNTYRSWINHREAQLLRQSSLIINLLYNAEKYLSLERGVAVAILYTPPETTKTLAAAIVQHRRAFDLTFQQVMQHFDPQDEAKLSRELQQIVQSRALLDAVRADVDVSLKNPGKGGRRDLPQRFFDISTLLIGDINALIEKYSQPYLNMNAEVTQQMLFKHVVWEITEYAGQEYAVIGRMIVENRPPSIQMQEKLYLSRGRIQYGWELADELAQGTGWSETIRPFIDEAETHYFLTFDQIKDLFYTPIQEQENFTYPISIEIWLELASQAVDSLLTMKSAALNENQKYVDAMERDAEWGILTSLFLFIAALLLSYYSWRIIIGRVIRPVNSMVNALYKATHGEAYELPRITNYNDEIGKLGRVLEVFQEYSRQLEQSSKDLEDQKNYLKTVLATIVDAIITVDNEGRMQMVNPAVEALFGYREDEILGKKISLVIPMPGNKDMDHSLDKYLSMGKAGTEGREREVYARRKDGTFLPVEVAFAEMNMDHGSMFVGVFRDITQRKKAEEEIEHYLRDLENSNRELDDFAYIASHDLKEPLRGVHNFSRFLLEDYEDKLDDEGKNMLNTVARLTQQMEGLLNALLHYSRLGRTELSIRETDLNTVVESVMDIFAITIKEKNAKVIVERRLPTLVCDHVRIAEVFQNLVGNSLKYNDKEEKIIEIGYLDDHPSAPGEHVFYVRDNGIGIEEKHLDTIFKIFHRLHPRSAYGGGTGSGLTIAKKIITQHGGKMWAESPGKGKGTTFFFTIHVQERETLVKAPGKERGAAYPM